MVGLYDDEEACPGCDGTGEQYAFGEDGDEFSGVLVTCFDCLGSGLRTRPERDEDERRDR